MIFWIWICFSLCCYPRTGIKMDDSTVTTPTKSVTNIRGASSSTRPWKWCMICNTVLQRKDCFRSFRPENKGSAELVERCNLVLDINIIDVTPNSYNVCGSCVRRIKKVEDGWKTKVKLMEDFKQTVTCNRLTSPTTTPISSPANDNTRTKRMAKDQGTPGAASGNEHERGPTGTGSRPRKRALFNQEEEGNPEEEKLTTTPQQIVEVSKS